MYNPKITQEEFINQVTESNPDLIAFSATTNSFPLVAQMAAWINKTGSNIPVIVGGTHAILNPNEAMSTVGIDFVCLGDGEDLMVELCRALENGDSVSGIQGLGRHNKENIVLNKPGRRVSELDDLPFPDRHIFDYKHLYNERDGAAMMMASRGCPYQCTYCCNKALRKATGNIRPLIRFHSVDYVIGEARKIMADFDFIKEFHFDDDILFLRRDWAEEFARRFPKEVGLPFVCNLRPTLVKPALAALLKQAGCIEVRIGLESGNDHIRNQVLQRKMTRQHIIDAVRICHDYKIKVMTFNMIGLPFETPRTIIDTIELNALARPD
ncbi:MAG TPA: B12-binding domain-containing radical SAM protein, partial [Actinobacteria bacterium]|nr:B12-binding domain-containing radical SAM protein [Actinomycetes bacterium]HEX21716.1 B12-binding domain-containing radical SAM protein [Actinomycetota bacterium]